ncbi:MAG TPA: hypothetical protein VD813_08870, partial [Pseudonocardia sp.]|nr:hypothetical protein [Pseudonocardia sp.]
MPHDRMPHDRRTVMSEALRLTREGRLTEATALLQRSLGGSPAGPDPDGPDGPPPARRPARPHHPSDLLGHLRAALPHGLRARP